MRSLLLGAPFFPSPGYSTVKFFSHDHPHVKDLLVVIRLDVTGGKHATICQGKHCCILSSFLGSSFRVYRESIDYYRELKQDNFPVP